MLPPVVNLAYTWHRSQYDGHCGRDAPAANSPTTATTAAPTGVKTRLHTANEGFAQLFFSVGAHKKREIVRKAIGWVQENHELEVSKELDRFLLESTDRDLGAEFGSRCMALCEKFDNLYFEQEEAGMSEEVWVPNFHKSRAYASIAAFCKDGESHEALYEALHSVDDNRQLLSLLMSCFTVGDGKNSCSSTQC